MDKLKDLNLLFLEDNEEFAKNTTEFLEGYFKKVFHKSSIKSAIEYFAEMRVDVILTDIKLSDGNGLDFISKIREMNSDVPIVVLSAYKDEKFLFKAIPLGIAAYELKPISYNKFIFILEQINTLLCVDDDARLCSGITYSFKTKTLISKNSIISLNKKEAQFIELLLKNEILTNELIERNIYENKMMSTASLKNFIYRLRKKIGWDLILTLNGVGYRLKDDL